MKTLIPAASLFAAILAAHPALATDVEFAYSARDLSNSARVAELYDRLAEEADAACDLYENSGLFAVDYRKACAAALTDEIVAKIDSGALTALHEENHSKRFAQKR